MRPIIAVLLCLFLSTPSWSENCPKAIEFYNQATGTEDLKVREECFKEAIPLCSDSEIRSRVYNNLADTYEQTDRISLALSYYRKALETKSDLATAYFSVGDIFFRVKDYCSAAVMYEKGLKYRPEDQESSKRREEALDGAKKYIVIYFDFDSFEIPFRYVKRLDAVCAAIKKRAIDGVKEIMVIGHTCSLGVRAYNRRLSFSRAEAVATYLKEFFPADSPVLTVTGEGEDAPLLVGADKTANTLNRRVEITLKYSERNRNAKNR